MSKYFEVKVLKYTLLTSKIEVKVSKSKYATSKFEAFQSWSQSISKSKPKFQILLLALGMMALLIDAATLKQMPNLSKNDKYS